MIPPLAEIQNDLWTWDSIAGLSIIGPPEHEHWYVQLWPKGSADWKWYVFPDERSARKKFSDLEEGLRALKTVAFCVNEDLKTANPTPSFENSTF